MVISMHSMVFSKGQCTNGDILCVLLKFQMYFRYLL